MNMLHRTALRQFVRFTETAAAISTPKFIAETAAAISTPTPKFIAEPLKKRALVRVHGADVVPFLQGLITNDMKHLHLDKNPSMFTMFLHNSGRVLFDSIVYRTNDVDTFIIECDRELSKSLQEQLRLYRVRRKINIVSVDDKLTPWVVFDSAQNGVLPKPCDMKPDNVLLTTDPRLKQLGIRIIQPKGNDIKTIQELFPDITINEPTSSEYMAHRYALGVGEGIIDHPPGKCFALEANCDFLNGVSFQKGCYVGQELTARVYHTGVVRKRLMPLKLSSELKPRAPDVQTVAGAPVGTIRGTCEKQGLALLRVEQVLKANELVVDGKPCTTFKPDWWPTEIPSRPPPRRP